VDHDVDASTMAMDSFDTYSLAVSVFVIEKATNRSVPTVAFAAGGAPGNSAISSVGIKTKSNYTYDSGTGPATVEGESSVIHIEEKGTRLAQAFTLCLLLFSWALAIGSTYIMLLDFS
jgi:hypothetical protein